MALHTSAREVTRRVERGINTLLIKEATQPIPNAKPNASIKLDSKGVQPAVGY